MVCVCAHMHIHEGQKRTSGDFICCSLLSLLLAVIVFIIRFIHFILYVKVLLACMSNICMFGAHEGQERLSGPLKLKLQMVVNHHYVGAGNLTRILLKSKCCYPLRCLSGPFHLGLFMFTLILNALSCMHACMHVPGSPGGRVRDIGW